MSANRTPGATLSTFLTTVLIVGVFEEVGWRGLRVRSNDLEATEDLYRNVSGLQVSMRAAPDSLMFDSPEVAAAQLIVNDSGHVGLRQALPSMSTNPLK